jgi:hypothetical protein
MLAFRKPPKGGFLFLALAHRGGLTMPRLACLLSPLAVRRFLLGPFAIKTRPFLGVAIMNRRIHALPLFALLCLAGTAGADTLLIERTQAQPATALPTRGQTAAQVEATFGAPQQKLEPRGGQRSQWPVINRWVYPGFTVYFEKSRVIDVVATQASPDEIGPKPPIR